MSPVIISGIAHGYYGLENTLTGHLLIGLKAVIVLSSWILGYFAIKHLPLTIRGPINATRPVIVLVGALLVFGERLNLLQWAGILIGFASLFFISRVGSKEGFSLKNSCWLTDVDRSDKLRCSQRTVRQIPARFYKPLEVQAWYSLYQACIMALLVLALHRFGASGSTPLRWRWSITGISVFLTAADIAYFYSLSMPDSMISVVSMIRRGSVLVSFVYGVIILHEKHVREKLIDLGLLLLSLGLLVAGS